MENQKAIIFKRLVWELDIYTHFFNYKKFYRIFFLNKVRGNVGRNTKYITFETGLRYTYIILILLIAVKNL